MTYGTIEKPIFDATDRVPVTYHARLESELVRALEVYAATVGHKPETIIAEAVRAYLGVDA